MFGDHSWGKFMAVAFCALKFQQCTSSLCLKSNFNSAPAVCVWNPISTVHQQFVSEIQFQQCTSSLCLKSNFNSAPAVCVWNPISTVHQQFVSEIQFQQCTSSLCLKSNFMCYRHWSLAVSTLGWCKTLSMVDFFIIFRLQLAFWQLNYEGWVVTSECCPITAVLEA